MIFRRVALSHYPDSTMWTTVLSTPVRSTRFEGVRYTLVGGVLSDEAEIPTFFSRPRVARNTVASPVTGGGTIVMMSIPLLKIQ